MEGEWREEGEGLARGPPLSAELRGLGNLSFPFPTHPHHHASRTTACLPSVPGRVPYGLSPGAVQAGRCGRCSFSQEMPQLVLCR